jgi:hypothetical protein
MLPVTLSRERPTSRVFIFAAIVLALLVWPLCLLCHKSRQAAGRTRDEAAGRKIIASGLVSCLLAELRVLLHRRMRPGRRAAGLRRRPARSPVVTTVGPTVLLAHVDDPRRAGALESSKAPHELPRRPAKTQPQLTPSWLNEADHRVVMEERATGETRFRFSGGLFRVA